MTHFGMGTELMMPKCAHCGNDRIEIKMTQGIKPQSQDDKDWKTSVEKTVESLEKSVAILQSQVIALSRRP